MNLYVYNIDCLYGIRSLGESSHHRLILYYTAVQVYSFDIKQLLSPWLERFLYLYFIVIVYVNCKKHLLVL